MYTAEYLFSAAHYMQLCSSLQRRHAVQLSVNWTEIAAKSLNLLKCHFHCIWHQDSIDTIHNEHNSTMKYNKPEINHHQKAKL